MDGLQNPLVEKPGSLKNKFLATQVSTGKTGFWQLTALQAGFTCRKMI